MICLDTSAIMAVLMGEASAAACWAIMEANDLVISAGTLSEAYLVAARHRITEDLRAMMDELAIEVVEVDKASARRIGEVWQRWGKGRHAAALNFGDCFAYDLAIERRCKLLFVGRDFAQTDLESAL